MSTVNGKRNMCLLFSCLTLVAIVLRVNSSNTTNAQFFSRNLRLSSEHDDNIEPRLLQTKKSSDMSEISCNNVVDLCEVIGGELKCAPRIYKQPSCEVKNACLLGGSTLQLYGDSEFLKAYSGLKIRTMSIENENSEITISVVPHSERESSLQNFPTSQIDESIVVGMFYGTGNQNMGHVLGDNVWPVFQVLENFNAQQSKLMMIDVNKDVTATSTLQRFYNDILYDDLIVNASKMNYCFHTGYLGTEGLSYARGPFPQHPASLVGFRNFIYEGTVGNQRKTHLDRRTHPNILFVEKDMVASDHKISITNMDEVVTTTQKQFSDLTVKRAQWSKMSLKQQVIALGEADIMFTLPGSDLMNGLLLPDGATVVVPCRDDGSGHNSEEFRIWLNSFPHLRGIALCGDEAVVFNSKHHPAIVIPSLLMYMGKVIEDWYKRRSSVHGTVSFPRSGVLTTKGSGLTQLNINKKAEYGVHDLTPFWNYKPKMVVVVVWSHFAETLPVHIKTVQKAVVGDLLYVVVNTAKSREVARALHAEASHHANTEESQVLHLRYDSRHKAPSSIHGTGLVYATDFLRERGILHREDMLFFMDSDIYPFGTLSRDGAFGDSGFTTAKRGPLVYFWPNFLVMNLDKLGSRWYSILEGLDLRPTEVLDGEKSGPPYDRLDSGGKTHELLSLDPPLSIQYITGYKGEGSHSSGVLALFEKQYALPLPENCRQPDLLYVEGKGKDGKEQSVDSSDVLFYHIGSGGSDWRRCDPAFMEAHRTRLMDFIASNV